MSRNVYKQIYKKIKKYQTIVIARHIGPDPDAVTSQIALRDAIKLTFPNKDVYAVGASVHRFKKFGSLDKINLEGLNSCLLIITDVPNLDRVDDIVNLNYQEVIKIDHHPCQEKTCDLELVDETASSACQLVADFIYKTPLKMNVSIAENLFLGIVSDSDRFLLSYTTAKTFQVVSKLIDDYHLDFSRLYPILYERPINEIRFHGYIGENLEIKESGLAFLKIMPEIINQYNVDLATPSNMINDFNFIRDVLVWVFVTYDEKNEIYKINIRSRGPVINTIAEGYHGGGHKFASGARVKTMEEVDLMLQDLNRICEEYQKIR